MATKKTDNADELTPQQAADRLAGDPVPEQPPVEVEKGELTDTVIHGGAEWPRGTKTSAIKPKLKADELDRLEELGLVAE